VSRSLAFVYSLVLTMVMVGATGGLTPVAAQGLTGQITGTITDSGGGVLPGATVVATNTATQATRQAVTNAEGVYVVPDLLAGSYNLTVTMSGFKTYQQTGVTVGATDRVVLRDIVLEVGGFEETISVTADATRVETTTAARSGTVARDTIDEISAKGRDFTAYLRLLPGVIDTASRETPGAPGGGLQINGRTSFNFTMDGITQKDTGANGGGYTAPSLDSIAEVRVQTSNFQAEYGRSSGASINVVTRSGSQSFRGSVAYYKRNDALNGNEYQRRQNCENGLTAQCDAAPYNYDNTAWTFGGPLLIPGTSFNENRDKLFFFFSQDLLPRKTPGNTVTERVPTLLERQGNFSQTFDSQGRLVNIRDASTGLPCTVTSGGAGCFAGNIIPANRLDPLGQAYLNLMPLPNTTDPNGTNRYNFSVQARDDLLRTDQILRVDWNVSSKATFYSRLQFGYDRTTGNIVAQNWPIYPRKWEVLTRGIVNTFLYSFSPTTFMEVTQGLNWAHQDESPLDQAAQDRNDRRLLPGYQPFFADANPMNVIPNASFSGGLPQNPSQFSVGNRFPFEAYNRIWNTSSNVTKVLGEHTVKAGIFWEYTQRPAPNGTNFNGAFSFNADGENPCNTNVGLANALLGCVTQYTESNQRPYGHGVFNNVEWYVQDNWRVASNVTLDYGLRFYSVGATRSEGDKVAQFEPSAWNAADAPRVYIRSGGRALDPVTGELLPPSFIGLQVPGTGEPYNGMVVYDEQVRDTAPIQVGPRVGIAWDVTGDGRTAVRAGWGMFFDRFPDHELVPRSRVHQPDDPATGHGHQQPLLHDHVGAPDGDAPHVAAERVELAAARSAEDAQLECRCPARTRLLDGGRRVVRGQRLQ